jgi:hypothetical protein
MVSGEPEISAIECPRCGKEMETGYLLYNPAPAFSMIWRRGSFEGQEKFKMKEMRLLSSFAPVNIEGYRCPECELLILEYGKAKKKAGMEDV